MIKIRFNNYSENELENYVIKALKNTLEKDLAELRCMKCDADSLVSIQLRKNRLNGINITIDACCDKFRKRVEEILLISELH